MEHLVKRRQSIQGSQSLNYGKEPTRALAHRKRHISSCKSTAVLLVTQAVFDQVLSVERFFLALMRSINETKPTSDSDIPPEILWATHQKNIWSKLQIRIREVQIAVKRGLHLAHAMKEPKI